MRDNPELAITGEPVLEWTKATKVSTLSISVVFDIFVTDSDVSDKIFNPVNRFILNSELTGKYIFWGCKYRKLIVYGKLCILLIFQDILKC